MQKAALKLYHILYQRGDCELVPRVFMPPASMAFEQHTVQTFTLNIQFYPFIYP